MFGLDREDRMVALFGHWHPYVCLVPRRVAGRWTWLATVERRLCTYDAAGRYTWQYRIPLSAAEQAHQAGLRG